MSTAAQPLGRNIRSQVSEIDNLLTLLSLPRHIISSFSFANNAQAGR